MPKENDKRFQISKLVRKQVQGNLDSKSIFCPFCGRIQSSEALFCGFCGKKIKDRDNKNDVVGQTIIIPAKENADERVDAQKKRMKRWKDQIEKKKDEIPTPQTKIIEEELNISEMEGQLITARTKYAEEYRKFMTERKKGLGFFTKSKERIWGAKVKDDKIPMELKALETEYDQAAVTLGNEMFENGVSKSEIFKRVVIQEQEELAKIKVENLPPKEKGILRKGLDKYMALPRPVKIGISIVLSTGAIATFSWATIAGAGGLAAFTTTKLIRSAVGVAATQGTIKGFNLTFKEKSGEKREAGEKNLIQKFIPDDISTIKKEYEEILELERKRKRNRIIAKGVLSLAVGGTASFGAGYAIGGISSIMTDKNGNNINPDKPTPTKTPASLTTQTPTTAGTPPLGIDNKPSVSSVPTPADNFTNKGVSIEHGKGAIAAIKDLQSQIKTQYPNGDYPGSVKDFMNTDATKEAIKLGFYDPNKIKESALIQEGSVLKFKDGKIVLGKTNASGEFVEWNKKNMIDTDSKPKVVRQETTRTVREVHKTSPIEKIDGIKPKVEKGIDEKIVSGQKENVIHDDKTRVTGQTIQTGKTINTGKTIPTGGAPIIDEAVVSPKVTPTPESTPTPKTTPTTEPTPVQKPSPTAEELKTKINTQLDLIEKYPELKESPFIKNPPLGVTGEKLVEINKVYQANIVKVTEGNDEAWSYVKNIPTKNFLGEKFAEGDKIIPYLNKLKEISGLTPEYNIIQGDEPIEKYVVRVYEWAARNGELNKLKNINLEK